MNLGLFRREHLQSGDSKKVGDAVVDQFQRTHGALTAWQESEHTDDGGHTDIHATSITVDPGGLSVKGDIASADGGFTGEGGQVALGDLGMSQSTPGMNGGMGLQIGKWRIISDEQNSPSTPTYPGLIFQYLAEVVGNFIFRFIRLGVFEWAFAPQTGVLVQLGWGANRLSNVVTRKVDAGQAVEVAASWSIEPSFDAPASFTYPGLAFRFMPEAGAPPYVMRLYRWAANHFILSPGNSGAFGQRLQLGGGGGERLINVVSDAINVTGAATVGTLSATSTISGDSVTTVQHVRSGTYFFEAGRGVAQGQRIPWAPLILTSAGHNCGGSIAAYFSLVGYQLFWSCYAVNINVPSGYGNFPYLLITNPPGYPTISGFTDQPIIRLYVPGLGDEPGYVQCDANYIQLYRFKGATWPPGIGHVIGQGFYWIG